MKKIDVPNSALVSILIIILSVWVVFVNGFEMIAYYQPLSLTNLSERNIETDRYVKGTISECVTVPITNRQDVFSGSSGMIIGALGRSYESYTVPILGEQYIRVYIYDMEALEKMERIVAGGTETVSFIGQIKEGEKLNTDWYNRSKDFDQSKVLGDYVIWQKSIDTEENLFFAGIFGIVIGILVYYLSGGIHLQSKIVEESEFDIFLSK